jgi:hypothetical protein
LLEGIKVLCVWFLASIACGRLLVMMRIASRAIDISRNCSVNFCCCCSNVTCLRFISNLWLILRLYHYNSRYHVLCTYKKSLVLASSLSNDVLHYLRLSNIMYGVTYYKQVFISQAYQGNDAGSQSGCRSTGERWLSLQHDSPGTWTEVSLTNIWKGALFHLGTTDCTVNRVSYRDAT